MNRCILRSLFVAGVLAVIAPEGSGWAQQTNELFDPLSGIQPASALPSGLDYVDSGIDFVEVEIYTHALPVTAPFSVLAPPKHVSISLPNVDTEIEIYGADDDETDWITDSDVGSSTVRTWIGRGASSAGSLDHLVLVEVDGEVYAGDARIDGESYIIEPAPGEPNRAYFIRVDPKVDCGTIPDEGEVEGSLASPPLSMASTSVESYDLHYIDVGHMFNPKWASRRAERTAQASRSVQITNLGAGLFQSLVGARTPRRALRSRFVGLTWGDFRGELQSDPPTAAENALCVTQMLSGDDCKNSIIINRMRASSTLNFYRNGVSLDLIMAVLESAPNFGAAAARYNSLPNPGTHYVSYSKLAALTQHYTGAHEFGHLLRMRHDPVGQGSPPPQSYATYNQGFMVATYRTIMGTGGSNRLPIFSDPQECFFLCFGIAVSADNKRAFADNDDWIGGFR